MPPDFPADERGRLTAREQGRSKALSESGKLIGHWRVPVKMETVSIWEVSGPAELNEFVMSLPAVAWAKVSATPLVPRDLEQLRRDAAHQLAGGQCHDVRD